MKIAFLIRQLSTGGAEQQLIRAAAGLAARGHEVCVFTFYAGGSLSTQLADSGVTLVNLRKSGRWDVFGFLSRLSTELSIRQVEVLYSYLPSANVIGAWLRSWRRVPRLVSGVRASRMEGRSYDWLGSAVARVEDAALRRADAIISNSHAGAARFAGWRVSHGVHVVPNGIDGGRYQRDPRARDTMRKTWGVSPEILLVGVIGRLDPMKGHEHALAAFSAVRAHHTGIRLVIVGDGTIERIAALRSVAARCGLEQDVLFAPAVQPVSAAYSALDILLNSSVYGEGFSNVLCEALLCGCRCVATDVGDSAMILGMPEFVVPPGDDAALARAIELAIATDSAAPWAPARERVRAQFSTATMLDRTESILTAVVRGIPSVASTQNPIY